MKTLTIILMSIFALQYGSVTTISQDDHTLTATYKGLTEDYYFEFLDADGNSVIFHEVSGDVPVNLFEEELIGKTFTITWEDYTFEETDDDGESTGEQVAGKRILALEEQE